MNQKMSFLDSELVLVLVLESVLELVLVLVLESVLELVLVLVLELGLELELLHRDYIFLKQAYSLRSKQYSQRWLRPIFYKDH
jgi:hypothetical protein